MFVLKSILYFTISFIILSLPINEKKLFDHIDYFARPYTSLFFKHSKVAISSGKKTLIKLFTNSSYKNIDQVRTQYSSHLRREYQKVLTPTKTHEIIIQSKNDEDQHPFVESYTQEEEELLEKVMHKD